MTRRSTWMRIDLHLHTPAFDTFKASGYNFTTPGEIDRFAQEYAERLDLAGVSIAAVTDYNSVRAEWYEPIKQATESRGITVLPGAELTIAAGRAFHILAVFEAGSDPEEVNKEIQFLHNAPEQLWDGRKKKTLLPKEDVVDALRSLRDRTGCLLIPAHPDDDSGIIKELRVEQAVRLLNDVGFDALDHPGGALHKIRSCKEAGVVAKSIPAVEFSDCKHLDDLGCKEGRDGTRQTWIKVTEPSLDAIRFALRDEQMRVRLEPPQAPANTRILSMSVEGTGFLGGCRVEFDPHLNTLIGGFGTGKTALLEVLAYGLDLRGLAGDDQPKGDLVRHALGDGGTVRINIERPGSGTAQRKYLIERMIDRDPVVMGVSGPISGLSLRTVFEADHEPILLRHGSIASMSGSVERCRNLFDRLIGREIDTARQDITRIDEELKGNDLEGMRAEIAKTTGTLADDPDAAEIQDLLRQLSASAQEMIDTIAGTTDQMVTQALDIEQQSKAQVEILTASFNQVRQQLHADGHDPDQYSRVQEELREVEDRLTEIEEERNGFERLQEQREVLLDGLHAARLRLSAVRAQAADETNHRLAQEVRVRVVPRGDHTGFLRSITAHLQGSGTSSDAKGLLVAGKDVDGREIAATISAGPKALQERFKLSDKQAAKICGHYADQTRLAELETMVPDDLIEINLGGKPLEKLSAGGRATAVLHLVFSGKGRCLIIDQPEDDLDNTFIFRGVVQMIREDKKEGMPGRQVITATHNPNIPVNGDADLVLVMEADEKAATVAESGSIDFAAVRDRICALLEGGEDAFRRRAERYRGLDWAKNS